MIVSIADLVNREGEIDGWLIDEHRAFLRLSSFVMTLEINLKLV